MSIRTILGRLYYFFLYNPLRYQKPVVAIRELLSHTPSERILSAAFDFAKASKLKGDYLEFGVFEGNTFVLAYHTARRNGAEKNMRFFAFDSFEGLPEINGADKGGGEPFKQGTYACNPEEFSRIIRKNGVDMGRVKLVPGWFDKVLSRHTREELGIRHAAIIWVDCDLYASTVPVLDFVTDFLQDGTILIFDDWFSFRGNPDMGEQRAFREWLARNPSIKASEFHRIPGWFGNSFIIHKKARR